MSARPDLVVPGPLVLNAVAELRILPARGAAEVKLGGNMARHPLREQWERELNRARRACGCDTGARGVRAALFVGAVLAAPALGLGLDWPWALAGGIGVVLAGGIAGKVAGLRRARAAVHATIHQIQAEMEGWRAAPVEGALAE